jgi:propionate CoA-transferase
MVTGNEIPAYNIPSGILFDMHREAAAKRPGVLTKIGMETFVDPRNQGCAMNARAEAEPIVSRVDFDGEDWLYFRSIVPKIAIIRATTADERGNLSYEHEGGYLGPLDQALAVRNNGGIVIAQVKRLVASGSVKPQQVFVPGILVDAIVVAPDQMQTTQTVYDPAISGEVLRPLSSFETPAFDVAKGDRPPRRAGTAPWRCRQYRLRHLSQCPAYPDRGRPARRVTWVIEQGAVGGVPLLDFQFGCSSNAEAIVPSPYQFTYFPGRGLRSLAALLPADRPAGLSQRLETQRQAPCHGRRGRLRRHHLARPQDRLLRLLFRRRQARGHQWQTRHRTGGQGEEAGRGGRAHLVLGPRAIAQGQDITYVTERCVMKLTADGIVVTEIAPGVDLERDILAQAEFPLLVPQAPKVMDPALFHEALLGLEVPARAA